MIEKGIAYTNESFDITGKGIVIEIKHSQNGLPKSTKLTSKESGLSWSVISRILFDHSVDKQIIFKNESVDYLRLSFQTSEKKEHSIKKILRKEQKGIFQYFVQPMNHESKPLDDEELTIAKPST